MRARLHPAFVIVAFLLLGNAGCTLIETQAQPQTPPAAALEYVGAWGVKGDGPGQLDQPVSLSTDSHGNIYVADAGSRFVHKFAPQGKPLLSFQEDPLKSPEWITLDHGGAIYVADPSRNSVFIFLPSGDRYRELRLRTRPTRENLLSVAVGWDGLIHVLDSNAAKVYTFTPRLRLIHSWQTPADSAGSRNRPGPIQTGPDGSLYVANPSGSRIMRFTREGQLLSEIGANLDGTGARLSHEFAVSSNFIFVMDTDGRMLHVWTLDGRPKLDVDLAPELGQAARQAPALAISPRNELLVLDTPETRVLRYHINF
ncbi:MAG: NHL repeat-containing protein [Candidatus Acidiferrales bacterium]